MHNSRKNNNNETHTIEEIESFTPEHKKIATNKYNRNRVQHLHFPAQ